MVKINGSDMCFVFDIGVSFNFMLCVNVMVLGFRL